MPREVGPLEGSPSLSRHEFNPNCPDCRPILLDPKTGKALPPEDPAMKAVNKAWDASPREEQEAFHRVTVKNSRDEKDLALLKKLSDRMELATRN